MTERVLIRATMIGFTLAVVTLVAAIYIGGLVGELTDS